MGKVEQEQEVSALVDSDCSSAEELLVLVQTASFLNLLQFYPAEKKFHRIASFQQDLTERTFLSAKIGSPQSVSLITQSGQLLFEELLLIDCSKRAALKSENDVSVWQLI